MNNVFKKGLNDEVSIYVRDFLGPRSSEVEQRTENPYVRRSKRLVGTIYFIMKGSEDYG